MYEYKVIAVMKNSGIETLEGFLNNNAKEGFEPMPGGVFDLDARIMVFLRKNYDSPAARRAKKGIEESTLGS